MMHQRSAANKATQCIEADQESDGFAQNARNNQYESALLRLPEDTLLKLMRAMPLDQVLRLRHTSRVFMRLFHLEPSFRKYHLRKEQNEAAYTFMTRIWTAPRLCFENQTTSWVEPMCPGCITLRGCHPYRSDTSEISQLYCTGCQQRHVTSHFSVRQRREIDSERLCRAHERACTLYDDMSLNLQQIKWLSLEGKTMMLLSQATENLRALCEAPRCARLNCPTIRIYKDDKPEYINIDIVMFSHIRIVRLPSGKICGKSLRHELRRSGESGSHRPWMPIFDLAHGDVLRAFDPNVCDCINWFGSVPRMSFSDDRHANHLALRPAAAIPWRKPLKMGQYTSTEGRCAFMRHGYRIDNKCFLCFVDIVPCESSTDIIVIKQKMRISVNLNHPTDGLRFFLGIVPVSRSSEESKRDHSCGVTQLQFHDSIMPIWRYARGR